MVKSYWHYWMQGWKFQLAMLIFHVFVVLILVPIALALELEKQAYYFAAIPLFIFVLVPLGGFLYCAFRPKPLPAKSGGDDA